MSWSNNAILTGDTRWGPGLHNRIAVPPLQARFTLQRTCRIFEEVVSRGTAVLRGGGPGKHPVCPRAPAIPNYQRFAGGRKTVEWALPGNDYPSYYDYLSSSFRTGTAAPRGVGGGEHDSFPAVMLGRRSGNPASAILPTGLLVTFLGKPEIFATLILNRKKRILGRLNRHKKKADTSAQAAGTKFWQCATQKSRVKKKCIRDPNRNRIRFQIMITRPASRRSAFCRHCDIH